MDTRLQLACDLTGFAKKSCAWAFTLSLPLPWQSHLTGEPTGDPGCGGQRRGGLLRAGGQREKRGEQDQPARAPERSQWVLQPAGPRGAGAVNAGCS